MILVKVRGMTEFDVSFGSEDFFVGNMGVGSFKLEENFKNERFKFVINYVINFDRVDF